MAKSALKPSDLSTGSPLDEICARISKLTGVQLGDRQRGMVESRLKKRSIDLGLGDIKGYLDYYLRHEEAETEPLISLLTTHHTYFFREFSHFEFLASGGLAQIAAAARKRGEKKIRIWSAASSRGQEAYSISMFMAHHLPGIDPEMDFEIIGTDVDPESIQIAKNGVFGRGEIKSVPLHYLSSHWARGTGDISEFVKAKASIKSHCSFEVQNLLKFTAQWEKNSFDLIFCRNVFIYFTPAQIKEVCLRMLKQLNPDGIFFAGISETLNGLELPIKSHGPSIYSHAKAATAIKATPPRISEPQRTSSEPLRVLCVDDSPSVLTLLKQILQKQNGFEIVGTAKNGLEAAQLLKTLKVDLMTLDIHMPEQDGLSYLKKNYSESHPPVVIVSSVSRDDADLAMNCLTSGAADYIEKPALQSLKERGEEIRTKLRCAFQMRNSAGRKVLTVDQSFSKSIVVQSPDSKLMNIMMGISHLNPLKELFSHFNGPQPPIFLCVEGSGNVLQKFSESLEKKIGKKIEVIETVPASTKSGQVFIHDARLADSVRTALGSRQTSILGLGEVTEKLAKIIDQYSMKQILIEDGGTPRKDVHLIKIASDIVPLTSFAYNSNLYLSKAGVKS